MEQLIAGAKFPAKCVKNEIHNLLTTLRLSRGRATQGAQFYSDALRSLQWIFEELTYIHELREFDIVTFLGPFLEVIQSESTDGQITAVALGSVDKFVSFGLIDPNSPRCMEAVNTLASGVLNCRFISSGSANDEAVLLKMVNVMLNCLRCPAGDYLTDACVWHMVRKCFLISRSQHASQLCRSSAESVLQQMVLTIFGTHKARQRRVRVTDAPVAASGGVQGDAAGGGDAAAKEAASARGPDIVDRRTLQVHKPYGFKAMHFVLRFLAFLLAYGQKVSPATDAKPRAPRARRPRSRSPSCDPKSPKRKDRSPADSEEDSSISDLGLNEPSPAMQRENLQADTHCLGLSLLNVALESGGDEIARSDELIGVIQDDICKSLLQNSRTESLSVLSLTLRAIFNLFLHFKRHLKVQLEIFFTSVHLKIACLDAAAYEQREVALESLLEFCREPELMLEVYENYDCDVHCTNLFETLVKFLVRNSCPPEGVDCSRAGFSPLHRLALSGLVSILHSIALRCEGHRHYTGEGDMPSGQAESTSDAATELQRKKEQKRRLTLAARTFNGEPSKSMSALQSLGFVVNPATPESMAEFLRRTPGLDPRVVGEYLSKRGDWNTQVRKAFMDMFPFSGLGVVEALRMVLGSFRLPGEAQLIERMMESFAEAYFTRQPVAGNGGGAADGAKPQDPCKTARWVPREKQVEDPSMGTRSPDSGGGPEDAAGEAPTRVRMLCSDTVFVLSYSIIMLNTDLHSVKVMKKMTDTEFVRNNRGIDNGKDMPEFFLRDIYEAIRDEEIRLHGDAPADGAEAEVVMDDFFWEGILRRSENIDEFSTTERLLSETPPGATERDMLQVVLDCAPLQMLTVCYEVVPDASVTHQAMMGLQDLARLNEYYGQGDVVNGLVRRLFQSFAKASASGVLSLRAQISLKAAHHCLAQHMLLFGEAEWRAVFEVFMQLWALHLLPAHLTELDDFAGADGRPLESLCDLQPFFRQPSEASVADAQVPAALGADSVAPPLGAYGRQESTDGFLESLTRWFEDETRDDEAESSPGESPSPTAPGLLSGAPAPLIREASQARADGEDQLPITSSSSATVQQGVRQYVARSGFAELFTAASMSKLPPENWEALAKALAQSARPASWNADTAAATPSPPGSLAAWHEVVDPIYGLELLTNMACMPMAPGQSLPQIWPLVSSHFERLLQHVAAGGGAAEQRFIERLVVNALRLCIRLIGDADLVPTLLTLMQHLARLPPGLFAAFSERIACGLLVLVKETNMPHRGLCAIFALLKRISEFPGEIGACNAGIECLSYWLGDDQELSRLLVLQQAPELLATLKAFALQDSTPASATALGQLCGLVPQLARGDGTAPQAGVQWQSLWLPTLHIFADIVRRGAERSSAQAFIHLQRLLLEKGAELALPFSVWKDCLEQVVLPLLDSAAGDSAALVDSDGSRQAAAAQLICRVVLSQMPDWIGSSPDGFPLLFLRLLHALVGKASSPSAAHDLLVETLKNLLLVVSSDPLFRDAASPTPGQRLIEAVWEVVCPVLPDMADEIRLILEPPDYGAAPPEPEATPQA